jgi:hypothetical protein
MQEKETSMAIAALRATVGEKLFFGLPAGVVAATGVVAVAKTTAVASGDEQCDRRRDDCNVGAPD